MQGLNGDNTTRRMFLEDMPAIGFVNMCFYFKPMYVFEEYNSIEEAMCKRNEIGDRSRVQINQNLMEYNM